MNALALATCKDISRAIHLQASRRSYIAVWKYIKTLDTLTYIPIGCTAVCPYVQRLKNRYIVLYIKKKHKKKIKEKAKDVDSTSM